MSRRAKPYRWPCDVIGCRCTIGSELPWARGYSWALCAKHWPMVPRAVKRVIRRKQKSMRELLAAADWYDKDGDAAMKALRTQQYIRAHTAYRRIMKAVMRRLNDRAVGL